jgi:hypothetical protein
MQQSTTTIALAAVTLAMQLYTCILVARNCTAHVLHAAAAACAAVDSLIKRANTVCTLQYQTKFMHA